MASAITHIAISEKIFDRYFAGKDKKKFMIGTVFPDIRYLGVIDRSKTHLRSANLNEIARYGSFEYGLRFHYFLDIVHENFLTAHKIYWSHQNRGQMWQALKFVEDVELYNRVKNWAYYVAILDAVLDEELAVGVNKSDVAKWHCLLKEYFSRKPDIPSVRKFLSGLTISPEAVQSSERCVEEIINDQKVLDYILDLYNNVEKLLEAGI